MTECYGLVKIYLKRRIEMAYGCRYCKMNNEYNERCVLTGELTKGAVKCDFEWKDCPEYKAAQKPLTEPQAQTEVRQGNLIQTSGVGTAGEMPFNG